MGLLSEVPWRKGWRKVHPHGEHDGNSSTRPNRVTWIVSHYFTNRLTPTLLRLTWGVSHSGERSEVNEAACPCCQPCHADLTSAFTNKSPSLGYASLWANLLQGASVSWAASEMVAFAVQIALPVRTGTSDTMHDESIELHTPKIKSPLPPLPSPPLLPLKRTRRSFHSKNK